MPSRQSRLAGYLLAGTVYFATATLAIEISRSEGNVAAIWVSNAILVGWMLRRSPSDSWALILAGLFGNFAANLATSTPMPLSLAYATINMVEVLVAYLGLRRARSDPRLPVDEWVFFIWIAIAAIAAPSVGAIIGASFSHWQSGSPFGDVFLSWWAGDALGMLSVLPVILTFTPAFARELVRGRKAVEFWAAIVLMLAISYVAMDTLARPFVMIGLPLLIVAYRLSLFGTCVVSLWTITAIMSTGVLKGAGWLPHFGAGPAQDLDLAERSFYFVATIIGPLLIAVVMGQLASVAARARFVSDQLRVITDNLPAMIAYTDAEFRYQFVNNRFSSWHQIRPGDILGRTARQVSGDFFESNFLDGLDAPMQRVLSGQPERMEIRMADGRDLEVQYEPHLDHGKVIGVFVLAQDVSLRKQNERRYRALLESAPDAMVVVDRERHIVLLNTQAERAFGYSRDELIGQPISLLVPEANDLDDEIIRVHLSDSSPMRVDSIGLELHGVRKDASLFPIEVVLSRIETEQGWLIASAIRDITARKLAERDLHESRERIRVTLNSIGDAVVACDAELRITMLNPTAEVITGWSSAEAIGRHVDEVVRLVDMETGTAPLSPLAIAIRDKRMVALQVNSALERRDGMSSAIEDSAAPIYDRGGNVVGGVMVFHDVSESRAMALKMSHLAQHDCLTDLPNRVLLEDRLTQALAGAGQGGRGALLFIDLDHFKTINDSLGHNFGDQVLQQVAQRLVASVRQYDTVSRQGGDEFVVLLARLNDPRDAARVAEKLIASLHEPIEVDGQQLHVGLSAGIALFPQDGQDSRTLMKQADTALYSAKQSGRGRYSYFTKDMSERAELRLSLEQDLRLALRRGECFLVYQPKVLSSGLITGMEALVRWRRSDGIVVPPVEFISMAEECGLIGELDEWVMREACRQNKAWQDEGCGCLPVSINVSLARFDPDKLLALVVDVLHESGLEPNFLEIEFTESQMFSDEDRARRLISGLAALRVRIAVDDFGTGYSNLSYLAQFHFDTIKIDRSFVCDMPWDRKHTAVVEAIIAMARALDARVVAEGVETGAQAILLAQIGCREFQGYLFSRPVDAGQFAGLLRQRILASPIETQESQAG